MSLVPSAEQRLIPIRNYIDKMPSLPTTLTKVMEICNLPNPSPNDLNRVISLDPVLTGQVLRLINSAYYSLPNHIASLTRAIIMLGINTVKNLALSTAILGYLGKHQTLQCLPLDAFWKHSICVGVTTKALAAYKGISAVSREEFFVAGLLHDLGKVPLSNCFPVEYQQAVDLAQLEQGPLHLAEMTALGMDHGMVGELIGEKWQLSTPLVETLLYHHQPEAAPPPHRLLISLVAIADIYASLYDIGSAGSPFPQARRISDVLKLVGMSWPDLQSLHAVVDQEIEKAQIFLKISQE